MRCTTAGSRCRDCNGTPKRPRATSGRSPSCRTFRWRGSAAPACSRTCCDTARRPTTWSWRWRSTPTSISRRAALLHARMHCCDWRAYDQQRADVIRGVRGGQRVVDPFAFLGISESPRGSAAVRADVGRHVVSAGALARARANSPAARPHPRRLSFGRLPRACGGLSRRRIVRAARPHAIRGHGAVVRRRREERDASRGCTNAFDRFIDVAATLGRRDREPDARARRRHRREPGRLHGQCAHRASSRCGRRRCRSISWATRGRWGRRTSTTSSRIAWSFRTKSALTIRNASCICRTRSQVNDAGRRIAERHAVAARGRVAGRRIRVLLVQQCVQDHAGRLRALDAPACTRSKEACCGCSKAMPRRRSTCAARPPRTASRRSGSCSRRRSRPPTILRATGSRTCFSTRCRSTRTRRQAMRCGRACRCVTCLGTTFAGRVAGKPAARDRAAGTDRGDRRTSTRRWRCGWRPIAEWRTAINDKLARQRDDMSALRHRPFPAPSRGRVRPDVGSVPGRSAAGGVRGDAASPIVEESRRRPPRPWPRRCHIARGSRAACVVIANRIAQPSSHRTPRCARPASSRSSPTTIGTSRARWSASVRAHSPEIDAFVAICDGPLTATDPRDAYTEISIRDLGLPQFDRFTFQYTILELNTAIKPWVFAALFARGYERVIYFDPDIKLYGSGRRRSWRASSTRRSCSRRT